MDTRYLLPFFNFSQIQPALYYIVYFITTGFKYPLDLIQNAFRLQ